jgi:hypothetical protein
VVTLLGRRALALGVDPLVTQPAVPLGLQALLGQPHNPAD